MLIVIMQSITIKSIMLRIIIKSIILTVIMQSIIIKSIMLSIIIKSIMLSFIIKPFMLRVIMLNVIMPHSDMTRDKTWYWIKYSNTKHYWDMPVRNLWQNWKHFNYFVTNLDPYLSKTIDPYLSKTKITVLVKCSHYWATSTFQKFWMSFLK